VNEVLLTTLVIQQLKSLHMGSISSGEGFSADSYEDNSRETPVFVRYRSIPWVNHGKKKLTVRLALSCLCLMAGYGPRRIGFSFSSLKSLSLKSYPQSMIAAEEEAMQEGEEDDEEEEEEDDDDEDDSYVVAQGRSYLKRSAVHYDSNSARHYFVAGGKSQWLDAMEPIYDEETGD
jgi:hypothetical protein